MLAYHAQWLDASASLTQEVGGWLYGLLARLSLPLHPEAAALVRQVYRRCVVLRSGMGGGGGGGGGGDREGLGRLNTLVTITGTFFEQAEGEEEEERGMEEEEEEEGEIR